MMFTPWTPSPARAAASASGSAPWRPSIFRSASAGSGWSPRPARAPWCTPGWASPRRTRASSSPREARRIAGEENRSLILVDGPPGIGCPVIASVTGASLVLAVTEPTVSGEHDLERVLSLTRHFNIPAMVCVNKWDLNPGMTERIEEKARGMGARIAGRVRYDRSVTLAQIRERAVVEIDAPCVEDIRRIWEVLAG